MDIMINIMQVSVSVVMALPDWRLIPVGGTFGLFPLHGDSLRKTS